MKTLQKYFLALVPPEEVLQRVTAIKEELREKFGIKYALKSPPHVTLKMPFSYNEAKEELLISRLSEFVQGRDFFSMEIEGVGTFGNRVIFLNIVKSTPLESLQSDLKGFCRKELHLIEELSDRNYHPHMTVAFKDLKPARFNEVLDWIKLRSFSAQILVNQLCLLKRTEGRWQIIRQIEWAGNRSSDQALKD